MPRGLSGGQRLENKSSLTELKSAITSWFGDFEKSCCLNDTTVNLQHTGGSVGFNASTVCLDSGSLSSNCSQFRWRNLPARVHTHTHTNKHVGISREVNATSSFNQWKPAVASATVFSVCVQSHWGKQPLLSFADWGLTPRLCVF